MNYTEAAIAAQEKGSLRALAPGFVRWEKEGQEIVGRYKSVSESQGQNDGTYNMYVFETDSGMVKFHCGKVFDDDQGAQMLLDKVYIVRYLGQTPLPGTKKVVNRFETFEVPGV